MPAAAGRPSSARMTRISRTLAVSDEPVTTEAVRYRTRTLPPTSAARANHLIWRRASSDDRLKRRTSEPRLRTIATRNGAQVGPSTTFPYVSRSIGAPNGLSMKVACWIGPGMNASDRLNSPMATMPRTTAARQRGDTRWPVGKNNGRKMRAMPIGDAQIQVSVQPSPTVSGRPPCDGEHAGDDVLVDEGLDREERPDRAEQPAVEVVRTPDGDDRPDRARGDGEGLGGSGKSPRVRNGQVAHGEDQAERHPARRDGGEPPRHGQRPPPGPTGDVVHSRRLTGHRPDNVTGSVGRQVPLRRGCRSMARCRCGCSVRWRSWRRAGRSSSTRARRWRSSRWSPPNGGRSPATSWRRCFGPRPTTRPPEGPCAERCRPSGRPSAGPALRSAGARSPWTRRRRIDLVDFERLSASGSAADLEAAVALARGPFLAGFALRDSPAFDEWQAAPGGPLRSDDRRRPGSAGRRAVCRRGSRGRPGCRAAARRTRSTRRAWAATADRAARRGGDRGGAIRQYRELVALFDRELGVAPLRETTEPVRGHPRGSDRRPSRRRCRAGRPAAGQPGRRAVVRPTAGTPACRPRRGARLDRRRLGGPPAGTAGSSCSRARPGSARRGSGRRLPPRPRRPAAIVLAARGYPAKRRSRTARSPGCSAPGRPDPMLPPGSGSSTRPPGSRSAGWSTCRRPCGSVARPRRPAPSARVRLLDALVDALSALVAGDRPGLLWVDDLHLADDPSRRGARLSRPPSRRTSAAPAAGVASGGLRPDRAGRRPTTSPDCRGPRALELPRLERDAIAEIVRAARPDGGAADALIDAIASDSEGLPLHVVAALASDDPPGTRLPRGVQALFLERLARSGRPPARSSRPRR